MVIVQDIQQSNSRKALYYQTSNKIDRMGNNRFTVQTANFTRKLNDNKKKKQQVNVIGH